ncbi:MAG: N-acetylneuraminate synthase family protein [Verrucomicrobiae bacterium]|nr:N-acetylneuraminate synthase family protein [Verrucomicrobiae bacterium]
MSKRVKIGNKWVGEGEPAFIAAEIGINHNGSMETAKKLIDAAVLAGCDAVKFQKRTPELCVPPDQQKVMRETPWGYITYLDYRRRIEFGLEQYREIEKYCRQRKILWFASCWDVEAVDFMEKFKPVCYKVPSACITDLGLLRAIRRTRRPVVMSTGMSTMDEIKRAVKTLGMERLVLLHCTSTYPCRTAELNLNMIPALKRMFPCPVGYSGHEVGLQTTYAAVVLKAAFIERHITLDRAMWGSDHAASLEPGGLMRLCRDVRVIEAARGDGIKRVYESEKAVMKKLRRCMAAAK